ncbi:MAG: hypothetical protein EHM14_01780 [Methanothrix sp.]|nr:MAG: hypothetical protein EHM14_01780 [Methanothrix sp.]
MKKTLIPACLAIIVLAACLASAALSSPNSDISQESSSAKAGSVAFASAPSVNVDSIDIGQAASGNSKPVNLTVSVIQSLGGIQTSEAICGLERNNFEIDTLEAPSGGKAARIMSVSPTYAGYTNPTAPCSYWISIFPTADYLNPGYPSSPAKQNNWADGVYTIRLRYMNQGNEFAGKTFSVTIGGSASSVTAEKIIDFVAINSKKSLRDMDPIDQLNPQPEPPKPINPSF